MMRSTLFSALLIALLSGCTDIGSFSTEVGECYSGEVVEASFIREGFESGTRLALSLNTDALADGRGEAGQLWSSDGLFQTEVVSQMEQIAHDPLSQFQFPGGRIRNYLVYVNVSDGAPAMVVISLMENEKVEVRVMRPQMDCPSGSSSNCSIPALFGVFSLNLDETCEIPHL